MCYRAWNWGSSSFDSESRSDPTLKFSVQLVLQSLSSILEILTTVMTFGNVAGDGDAGRIVRKCELSTGEIHGSGLTSIGAELRATGMAGDSDF